jgi:hypothetical protein
MTSLSTPERTRKLGRDGKTYAGYPHSFRPERHLGPLARDFVMARNAVRRLARATAVGQVAGTIPPLLFRGNLPLMVLLSCCKARSNGLFGLRGGAREESITS